MPERVYMNRIPGEERIHVEIRADEIDAIMRDLKLAVDAEPAAVEFYRLLDAARFEFRRASGGGRGVGPSGVTARP
jgi:hypothetical protein